jgi:CubicO group peptidase (beta-lactamase class C family)
MKRRTLIQGSLALAATSPLLGAMAASDFEAAGKILADAVEKGPVAAATIHVVTEKETFTRACGKAKDADAMFLLGSISKPICMTALMTLYDQGKFQLDNPLQKFLPKFTGEGREKVTLRHVLSHVSGLPDQLPENNELRKKHAALSEFVDHTLRTPLSFEPGSKYQYSSMGILLAARVAEIISGADIHTLVERTVFEPLKMKHSAQGLGRFKIKDFVSLQTEHAAPESGGGDPTAKEWDWNSAYWRKLGAPWGGTHASAPDIALWLAEFLHERGAVVKPATARMMVTNQNKDGQTRRGLGFGLGLSHIVTAFGHTGSTGTIAWADPASKVICVVLTSLPARAADPHPANAAAGQVAKVVGGKNLR